MTKVQAIKTRGIMYSAEQGKLCRFLGKMGCWRIVRIFSVALTNKIIVKMGDMSMLDYYPRLLIERNLNYRFINGIGTFFDFKSDFNFFYIRNRFDLIVL